MSTNRIPCPTKNCNWIVDAYRDDYCPICGAMISTPGREPIINPILERYKPEPISLVWPYEDPPKGIEAPRREPVSATAGGCGPVVPFDGVIDWGTGARRPGLPLYSETYKKVIRTIASMCGIPERYLQPKTTTSDELDAVAYSTPDLTRGRTTGVTPEEFEAAQANNCRCVMTPSGSVVSAFEHEQPTDDNQIVECVSCFEKIHKSETIRGECMKCVEWRDSDSY